MKSAQCSISVNFKRCCHQLNDSHALRTPQLLERPSLQISLYPTISILSSKVNSCPRKVLVNTRSWQLYNRLVPFQQLAYLATGTQFQFPVLRVGSVFLKLLKNLLQFWKRSPQKCQETPKFKGCQDIFTSVYSPHR